MTFGHSEQEATEAWRKCILNRVLSGQLNEYRRGVYHALEKYKLIHNFSQKIPTDGTYVYK
jgi:hypothetical protein